MSKTNSPHPLNHLFLYFFVLLLYLLFLSYIPVSPTAPHQSLKYAAISAANKKKGYTNPPPSNSNRRDEPGTPPPPHYLGDDHPSPYRKTTIKYEVPPTKGYEQACSVNDDVRVVPPHKTKSQQVKYKPSDSSNYISHPETENAVPTPSTKASSNDHP